MFGIGVSLLIVASLALIAAGWLVARTPAEAGWTAYPPLSIVAQAEHAVNPVYVFIFVVFEHALVLAGVVFLVRARRS